MIRMSQQPVATSHKETHGTPQNGFTALRPRYRTAGGLRLDFLVLLGFPFSEQQVWRSPTT